MHIELEQRQDLRTLRLHGRFLTGSNADYADLRSRLGSAARRNVVVDCRAAPYLDSTGIAFVVGLYNLLSRFGGHVALANVSPRIREVLKITILTGSSPLSTTNKLLSPPSAARGYGMGSQPRTGIVPGGCDAAVVRPLMRP